jgi:uncharacterized protein YaaQ
MSAENVHLLILAVVQEQDQDLAIHALSALKIPVVYLASAGGYLGRRNATLMVGLPQGREQEVLKVLQETCRQRVEYMTLPLEGTAMPMPAPVAVTVGGATVFALPVERFEEI